MKKDLIKNVEEDIGYLKNIYEFLKKPPSSMHKEFFIGIIAFTIFDKKIFAKNIVVKDFIVKVFNCEYKDYIYKSRTQLFGKLSRYIYSLESDVFHNIKVNFFLYFENNESRSKSISKWLEK